MKIKKLKQKQQQQQQQPYNTVTKMGKKGWQNFVHTESPMIVSEWFSIEIHKIKTNVIFVQSQQTQPTQWTNQKIVQVLFNQSQSVIKQN